jgi:hypothetical protein
VTDFKFRLNAAAEALFGNGVANGKVFWQAAQGSISWLTLFFL